MNTSDIKVSLIVAVYKSAPFLDKLIQSMINQTHKNIEIILVNDGSPDESGIICDKYAELDNRIIVIHKNNGGCCEARNMGLAKMTGQYFSIIDGDDWLAPDYVEYLLNLALKYNADMALSDDLFTTRDLQQNDEDNQEEWSPEYAAIAIIAPLFLIGPWNKLYKTSKCKILNLSFSVPWSGEGLYFSSMFAQNSNCVAKGHKRVYYYRRNNVNSGLTKPNVQMAINGVWNIKNIDKISPIKSRRLHDIIKIHIWENYRWLHRLIIATNSRWKYKKEYIEALWNIRWRFPYIIFHCEFWDNKKKFQMFKRTVCPYYYAKKRLRSEREDLLKDLEQK